MRRRWWWIAVAVAVACGDDESPVTSALVEAIRVRGLRCQAGADTFVIEGGQAGPAIESHFLSATPSGDAKHHVRVWQPSYSALYHSYDGAADEEGIIASREAGLEVVFHTDERSITWGPCRLGDVAR